MNWHYGDPIVDDEYLCCVKGLQHPISMYWHDGDWGYINDEDFMTSGNKENVVCYIGFDEIPMPEGW